MHGTNVLFTVEFVAQQADGEGAGPVDDLPAVGTALFEDGGRPVWGRHGDPYRADRLFGGAARGACDTGGRYGVVGTRDPSCPFGHSPCDLFADGAVAGNDLRVYAQDIVFRGVAVRNYAAEEIGRSTRHGRETCRDVASGAAFRRGEGQPALGEQLVYQFLHGGRFVPDDVVGDDFPQCLELPFETLSPSTS